MSFNYHSRLVERYQIIWCEALCSDFQYSQNPQTWNFQDECIIGKFRYGAKHSGLTLGQRKSPNGQFSR